MTFHLKIVLIGPCKSGKTTIANCLSDSTESLSGEYRPTQGVRIVEFEIQNINNKGLNAEVELWDCSGNLKFESFWPALNKDAHGVVFVYDSSLPDYSSVLDYFFESFTNQSNNSSAISNKNCLVIEYLKNSESQPGSLSNYFSKVPKISINVEENSQKLQNSFNKYIANLLSVVRDCNEQDELSLLSVL